MAWRIDPPVLLERLTACAWPFLLAACVANVASAAMKSITWQGLLAGVGGVSDRLRRLDLLSPLLVGALVNSGLPGRVGEVAKLVLARRRVGRRGGEASAAQVAGSIAAEHLVSTLAWSIVAVAVVMALPAPGAARALAILAGVGCLALTALAAALPAPRRALGGRWSRPSRAVADAWGAAHEGLRALRGHRAMIAVATAAFAQWAAQWAAILLTLQATGLGDAGAAGAGLILVTLTLGHAIPLMPGGVGTFQLAAMLPLTSVYGIEPSAALAFGILLQVSETAVSVCLGLVFLVRESLAHAQLWSGSATGSGSRRITLRNAMRSSNVWRASRAGRT